MTLFTDSFGNRCVGSYAFTNGTFYLSGPGHWNQAYAIYNLKKEYETFSADIVAPQGMASCADLTIDVSLDDSTTPTWTREKYSVTTGVVHLDISVAGATKMKVTSTDDGILDCGGEARFVNATLSR